MNINDYEDLNKVTIADFKVAIYGVQEEMARCLKNKDVKGFLRALKLKLKLNKLLDQKNTLVIKENNRIEKQH